MSTPMLRVLACLCAITLCACGQDAPREQDDRDVGDTRVSADLSQDTGAELDGVNDAIEPDAHPDSLPDVVADTSSDVSDVTHDAEDGHLSDAENDSGSDADGATGLTLREQLRADTIAGHTPLGYDAARDAMYAYGGVEDDGGRIACIYTGRTVDTNTSRTPSNNCRSANGTPMTCSFNTEHTWARYYLRQALTDGSPEFLAAEGDIHHLFPSDANVNNARWHFPFGQTDCRTDNTCAIDEESALGLTPGGAGDPTCPTGNLDKDKDCTMWVRPERQGDLARAQFYMAVRYEMSIDEPAESALRAWHIADPVDAWEAQRNQAAAAAQGNRNPFVDQPELVARITDF